MKKLLLIFILSSTFILAQEFQITNTIVSQYSIDRYANEIYYQREFTGEVFKTNSIGSYHILTEFTSLPYFSNQSHKAAFIDIHNQFDKDLYLYDFDEDTSYFLTNFSISGGNGLVFSPDDDKILFRFAKPIYYSFEDSMLHDPGFRIFGQNTFWTSDSTIIYWDSDKHINSYNIKTFEVDTILIAADSINYTGIAYNNNLNVFAYAWSNNNNDNALISIYDLSSNQEDIVFNYFEDGPTIGDNKVYFEYLSWYEKNNKLGFIGQSLIIPQSSFVYIFDYQQSNTNLYTEPYGNAEFKVDLDWLNQDTLTFNSGFLYGMDVTNPVNVEDLLYGGLIVDNFLLLQNYPNPFNPSTKIKYSIPNAGNVTIKVFDVLGKEIATLINEEKPTGEYEVEFNGLNLPSGIYFYQLKTGNFVETKKMILLK